MIDFEKKGGIIAIIGVAVAAVGGLLRVTRLGLFGMAILGLGVICWGLSGLIEKRIVFSRPGTRYSSSYYGLAARAWGAMLCIAGAGVAGFSVLLLFYPDVTFEQITASAVGLGLGWFLGGLIGMLYSLTLIAGRAEDSGTWFRRIITLPGRMLGLVILMISIVLAAAGLTRALFPQVYEGAVQAISDKLSPPPPLESK